jgi:hypothetical protein
MEQHFLVIPKPLLDLLHFPDDDFGLFLRKNYPTQNEDGKCRVNIHQSMISAFIHEKVVLHAALLIPLLQFLPHTILNIVVDNKI